MPKKKCSDCGATSTVKILYGMTIHEVFEASERGEIMLGGCYISDTNPTRHCKKCGQDFDGGISFPLFEMNSFEFYVGGYFGTSHFVYIDGKPKNKMIRYAKTQGGMFADLKHPKSEINLHPDILIKEIPLTSEQWGILLDELSALQIASWKDKYYDNEVCDGTQWELIIKFENRNKISKSGSNEYPPYWNKLLKVLKKYIGENIE